MRGGVMLPRATRSSSTLDAMKRVTVALAAVLVLSACAGSSGYADHQFESTAELAKVLAGAVPGCVSTDDKAKTEISLTKYGFDNLPCTDSHAEIWRSDTMRLQIQAKNPLGPGTVRIEGINWTVTVPTDRVDQVNKVLKGTVK